MDPVAFHAMSRCVASPVPWRRQTAFYHQMERLVFGERCIVAFPDDSEARIHVNLVSKDWS